MYLYDSCTSRQQRMHAVQSFREASTATATARREAEPHAPLAAMPVSRAACTMRWPKRHRGLRQPRGAMRPSWRRRARVPAGVGGRGRNAGQERVCDACWLLPLQMRRRVRGGADLVLDMGWRRFATGAERVRSREHDGGGGWRACLPELTEDADEDKEESHERSGRKCVSRRFRPPSALLLSYVAFLDLDTRWIRSRHHRPAHRGARGDVGSDAGSTSGHGGGEHGADAGAGRCRGTSLPPEELVGGRERCRPRWHDVELELVAVGLSRRRRSCRVRSPLRQPLPGAAGHERVGTSAPQIRHRHRHRRIRHHHRRILPRCRKIWWLPCRSNWI
ncbi:hypothetical protein C2845_PM13G10420 [Panicum miliaceum]|uniref:Uncharacterized protein n=1 Tax=Panicum miliaceum TaxID=4540 RepID=A0A3L6RLG6_PANMI|nr:hypothetical protein C2845_PM13G10420 [Panicum miliaceum]